MLTEKDYCDYDTCVALKELGYNDVTQFFFNKDEVRTPRIPLYEAQKWMREKKNIIVYACYYSKTDKYNEHWYWILYQNRHEKDISGTLSKSYEEALLEGIKEAVKLLMEEK